MREILFRAKTLDGEWVQGFLTHKYTQPDGYQIETEWENDKSYIETDWEDDRSYDIYPVQGETIGQYTGLTDENGVKIFEGDIIRRKRIDGNWYNYEVFWWENCWGIKGGAEVALLILPLCGLQVIGNIYDNPELIKEDTE